MPCSAWAKPLRAGGPTPLRRAMRTCHRKAPAALGHAGLRGERHPRVRTAGLRIGDMGTAVVRLGDRLHDRKPEPGATAASGRVDAGEAVEGTRDELRREAAAVVEDVELDATVGPCHLQPDVAAAVPQRVVDEVAERLLEAHPVRLDPQTA